jgi:hypothetical protein
MVAAEVFIEAGTEKAAAALSTMIHCIEDLKAALRKIVDHMPPGHGAILFQGLLANDRVADMLMSHMMAEMHISYEA